MLSEPASSLDEALLCNIVSLLVFLASAILKTVKLNTYGTAELYVAKGMALWFVRRFLGDQSSQIVIDRRNAALVVCTTCGE